MRIVFVCTGNICRSPMAEAMLRHELRGRGCDGITVVSRGTWATSGDPATDGAIAACRSRGVDLTAHRSRPVDPNELRDADLIVAMTSVHREELSRLAPGEMDKVVLLKELAELEPAGPSGSEAADRVRALLSAERPRWRRALDVDDPIGLPFSAYERCAGDLEAGVRVLADALCPR